VARQRAAAIFIVHLSARYAQTRLAPSPCLSLTSDPTPPASLPPAKCNTKYSPERSAYVRWSRFMMRPSGVLTRFMAHTDYQVWRTHTKKFRMFLTNPCSRAFSGAMKLSFPCDTAGQKPAPLRKFNLGYFPWSVGRGHPDLHLLHSRSLDSLDVIRCGVVDDIAALIHLNPTTADMRR
jgi:hypothetical protein